MIIGIISDVHDNLRHLDKAIARFKKEKIELLLHSGDWTCPFTMGMYRELCLPIKGVLGNGDADIEKFQYQLQNKFQGLDLELSERFLNLSIDNNRIAVFHGNDENLINMIIESQLFDLFCYGHTHKAKIEKIKNTLVINPGQLVGVYFPDKNVPLTIAIYDTGSKKGEIISL